MSVSICACGHPWPSHSSRKYGVEHTQRLIAAGESVCPSCYCPGYLDAVEADERDVFRVRQRQQRGNFGNGHPLMAALAKLNEDEYVWAKLECAGCRKTLRSVSALILDSAFYCSDCFVLNPEVYCGQV